MKEELRLLFSARRFFSSLCSVTDATPHCRIDAFIDSSSVAAVVICNMLAVDEDGNRV